MRECNFSGDFAEAGINALNGVGSIHHAVYSTAIVKKLLHMHPISLPYAHGSGILFPCFLESAKFGNSCLEVDGTIDLLKLGSIFFVILGGNVLDGIADNVHDAALYYNLWGNGLCPFFQATSSTPRTLISSKICIQLCFPSVSLIHKPKTSLMPSKS